MALPFKRIHFIAIGGSVMHQLALALHEQGLEVSGSDDEIFDPARSNLEQAGLLPASQGWDASRISRDIEAVVLGMHARKDNPELVKAQELSLPIFSFPEFIFQHARDKQRIVVAGSHGKTTITAMAMHVLRYCKREFDYVVGASIEGFKYSVKLSDAPVIVIEGDEYGSSVLDPSPKIHNYHHHIGLVNGIAWDHVNVFPDVDNYMRQFDVFADNTPKGGTLVYNEEDPMTTVICGKEREDVQRFEYKTHPYEVKDGKFYLVTDEGNVPVKMIGKHNMINISGAMILMERIGVKKEQFYKAISSFTGAAKRMELLSENGSLRVFRDYAHAPSKVKATVEALKESDPDKPLLACLELHTYSSLNKNFLTEYKGALDKADRAIVYFNPKALEIKKLPPIEKSDILEAFEKEDLIVTDNSDELKSRLTQHDLNTGNILLMSSGNFDNLDMQTLSQQSLSAQ